jgi:hypothetical protein
MGGLGVVDIEFPESVSGTPDAAYDNGYGFDVALCGGFLYLTDAVDIEMEVVDVSDPLGVTGDAVLATCGGLTGSALGLCVTGNRAYVADGASGLQVVELWPDD